MSKQVLVNFHGMEATGANKTEAKANAARQIEAALKGVYTPELITCGKHTALLAREPSGWGHRIITEDDGSIRHDNGGRLYICGQYGYEEAKRNAIHHVAQLGMDWQTTVSPDDVPAIVTDPEARRDLHRHAAWQRASYYARAILEIQGIDAHNYACEHATEWLARPWTSEAIRELSAA